MVTGLVIWLQVWLYGYWLSYMVTGLVMVIGLVIVTGLVMVMVTGLVMVIG